MIRIRITALSALLASVCFSTFLAGADRLPPIAAEKMTDAQKRAAVEATAPRGGELPGWLVALSRSPQVMLRTKALGDYVVREKKTLSPALTELAILLVARQWTQQYLWSSHAPSGLRAGLKQTTIDAIAEGRRPEALPEDQLVQYDFCAELLNTREVSDAVWSRAVARFSEEGVIDTEGLLGYYTLLSMTMNTGHTPLPDGAQPLLKPLRH